MSDAPSPRTGRSGGIIVAAVVGGSALAVSGWYLMTNRGGAAIDATGFDLSAAPTVRRPAAVTAAAPAPAPQASSLGMMKADAGVRIADANTPAAAPGNSSAAAKPADKKGQAQLSFTQAARKHEGEVQNFAMRMTNKYAVIRQYGKDWMKYPDLKKLNDDYARNHDPIAFMVGLSKAPNLGAMIKKYAGAPEIKEVIVQGMKQAPAELTSSAMEVMQTDHVMKDLVTNIVSGMGLPPSVTAMIGGGDPSKLDSSKMMGEMMQNPDMKKALQQGQQAPPVSLPNQR